MKILKIGRLLKPGKLSVTIIFPVTSVEVEQEMLIQKVLRGLQDGVVLQRLLLHVGMM